MTFHLCCRLIPACRQFAPMYRRKRKRKALHVPPDNVHSSPRFHLFEEQRGFDSFAISTRQHAAPTLRHRFQFGSLRRGKRIDFGPIITSHQSKRLITAIAVTIAFSPSILLYSRPLRTLPRIAFTLDFVLSMPACALSMHGGPRRSSGFCSVVKSLITATSWPAPLRGSVPDCGIPVP